MQLFKFIDGHFKSAVSYSQRRKPRGKGQSILCAGIMALTAGSCSMGPDRQTGEIGAVAGFLGGAVAEEPRAAVVARDTLSAGGSAADAAVAAFFTMTASYPLGASLGAGGACLAYDSVSNQTRSLNFMPKSGKNGGAVAIPTAVRAMAVMHATYGRLRWSQLVAPGERYARFGHVISRALARRMEASAKQILADPGLSELFAIKKQKAALRLKTESETISQLNLAAALSLIRSKGVAVLYGGSLGRKYITAGAKFGGKLTLTDLRAYRPGWGKAPSFKSGNETVYSLKTAKAGTATMHHLLQKYVAAGNDLSVKQSADIATAVFENTTTAGNALGGSAIAVIDRRGSAVACQFTLNGELGIGTAPRDLGFLLARPSARDGKSLAVTPVLAVNHHTDQAFLALSASGGNQAIAAAARIATAVLQRGETLPAAQQELRAIRPQSSEKIVQENHLGKSTAFGLVQVAFCPSGIVRAPRTCAFETDPRGFGLAASGK